MVGVDDDDGADIMTVSPAHSATLNHSIGMMMSYNNYLDDDSQTACLTHVVAGPAFYCRYQ